MRVVRINVGDNGYPIWVGPGILSRAGRLFAGLGLKTTPLVITNSKILRLHGKALLDSLQRRYGSVPIIRMGDGERFKNAETLHKIYEAMLRARADRRSWVVAFGGGVVGDVAGFAAATFMRGIPYVHIPTTLLAQVDSSIGGKVGINIPHGKNLIGAFHQPRAVLSDTSLLLTLPRRELASGLYEVVKAGAIRSERLLRYLERKPLDLRNPAFFGHVVVEAARIKSEVVSGDEREGNDRVILNYGHTVGHGLEAATGYRRFKHGEAVAWGMLAVIGFGLRSGHIRAAEARRLVRLIHRVERLPSIRKVSLDALWRAMGKDKKFRDGKVRMVFLSRLGECFVEPDVDPGDLRKYLRDFLESGGDNVLEGVELKPRGGSSE